MILSASAMVITSPSGNTYPLTQMANGAVDSPSNISDRQNESVMLYFFYGSGCPHCAMVEPYIESLAAKYPQIVLIKLEVFHNSTNQALFREFNSRYGIKNSEVPAVFIADKALIGEDAIKNSLESTIQCAIDTDDTPVPPTDNNTTENNTNPPIDNGTSSGDLDHSTNLTIAMVIVASLADSINPCAISVMIFLLIFLTSLGNRRKVLQVGIVYISTVFLVYFMAGLGMLTFLQSAAITRYVYYAAAALSIAIGLVNIKDFFFFEKGPTLAIPESRKPVIKKYIEKASIPAAVVLGFVVSLFELPCTGGIYLAILSLLSNSMTVAEGIPYLVLYNAIFVLPLAAILAIFYKGVSAEKINSWRLEKRRALRLMVGLVMLLLGAVMIIETL